MTTEEKELQATRLIALTNEINNVLSQPSILEDTLGVSTKLDFHLDSKTFAYVSRLSKWEVKTEYTHGALFGVMETENVKFTVCHNLL